MVCVSLASRMILARPTSQSNGPIISLPAAGIDINNSFFSSATSSLTPTREKKPQLSTPTNRRKSPRPELPTHPTATASKLFRMGFFYSKGFGGRRAGANITADRHGVRRPTFRFRFCGLNCFR
ncbi:unnamed protein product [Diplocarpon coronariae]